jgi:hypothetical protein
MIRLIERPVDRGNLQGMTLEGRHYHYSHVSPHQPTMAPEPKSSRDIVISNCRTQLGRPSTESSGIAAPLSSVQFCFWGWVSAVILCIVSRPWPTLVGRGDSPRRSIIARQPLAESARRGGLHFKRPSDGRSYRMEKIQRPAENQRRRCAGHGGQTKPCRPRFYQPWLLRGYRECWMDGCRSCRRAVQF